MSELIQYSTVFFLAASPISELRGAVPLGILVYSMPWWAVVLLAVFGNVLPVLFVYGIGGAWIRFVEKRQGFFHRITDTVLRRSHRLLKEKYEARGLFALAVFVGIPLPFTGAWTGSLAAYLLGVPFKKAFFSVGAGVCMAAIVVTLAVTGSVSLFKVFM